MFNDTKINQLNQTPWLGCCHAGRATEPEVQNKKQKRENRSRLALRKYNM